MIWTHGPAASESYGSTVYSGRMDREGNVVLLGQDGRDTDYTADGIVVKYDASGKQVFLARLPYTSSEFSSEPSDVAFDKHDNLYVAGGLSDNDEPSGYALLEKFTKRGAKAWEYEPYGYGFGRIALDSSENVIAFGEVLQDVTSTASKPIFIKFRNDGSKMLWVRSNAKPDYPNEHVVGLYATASDDSFYTVENDSAFSESDNTGSLIAVRKFDFTGHAESEQDYIGSPSHPFDAYANTSVFDPTTDRLYVVGEADFDPAFTPVESQDWFTVAYQPWEPQE